MKKYLLLFITCLLCGHTMISQDLAYSEQLINKVEKAMHHNHSSKDDNLFKSCNRSCITIYLMEAKSNWDKLTIEAQNYFQSFLTRPTLSGTPQVHFSDYFDFHYTVSGVDAVDPTDNNSNSVPDYVEDMAAIADHVYLTDSLRGYSMPPPDAGAGGSNYYDIYIANLDIALGSPGVYGLVAPETAIGDNPNSPGITEINSATSWMAMRHEYFGFGSPPLDAIKVTLAHEFCHGIDNGYIGFVGLTDFQFFLEAKGAWEEQKIYPWLEDNYQYLPHVFDNPDVALNWSNVDGLAYDGHWYSGWLFLKYLGEQTDDDIMINIIERMVPNWNGYNETDYINDELIANWNTNYENMFGQYLIANLWMESNSGYAPFNYTFAESYENYLLDYHNGLNIEISLMYSGSPITWNSNFDGNGRLMRLSADYGMIIANNNFTLEMSPYNPSVDMMLLKIDTITEGFSIQQSTVSANSKQIHVSDQSSFDLFALIIGRWDESVSDTLSEQYTLTIGNLSTSIDEIVLNTERSIIKITDVLGRTTKEEKNTPLLYTYDDGTVERKIIVE